jgi:tRNA A-37 threonylcarbamoyl transferase component Bud32
MDADAHSDQGGDSGPTEPEATPQVLDEAHLLVHGRTADVYLLDDTHVVRRLHSRDGTFPNLEVLRYLGDVGFPTARLVDVDGPDIVMERLHGPTLLQALDAEEISLPDGAQVVLDLHAQLHAVAPPPEALASGAAAEGDSILHLDLHPANIMMTPDGPYLLDWDSAAYGPAGVDLATTALVFAEVAADDNDYARAAHALLRAFVHKVGAGIGEHLDAAVTARLGNPCLDPDEVALIPDARAVVERELARL